MKSLKSITLKDNKFTLKEGLKCSFNQVDVVSESTQLQLPNSLIPLKIYNISNKVLVYASDKKLYLFGDTVSEYSDVISNIPTVISVLKNSEEQVFVISDDGAFFPEGQSTVINMPFGKYACVYNGRLFTANGNVLRFGKRFDFDNLSDSTDYDGYFELPTDAGNIVGIFPDEKFLVVVANHKIYHLKCEGEQTDYELTKTVSTNYLDIKENSCAKIGDVIFFYSAGGLYSVCENTIKFICDLDILPSSISGVAVYKQFYILSYLDNSTLKNICLDTLNLKPCTLNGLSLLSYDGGYYFNSQNFLCKICGIEYSSASQSVSLDFESCKQKRIAEIEIFSKDDTKLKITGDFGQKIYDIEKGTNLIKCNLISRTFSISGVSGENVYLIKKIIITYRILGD